MKAIATKTNPAFKIAQPLPVWPVGVTSRDDRAVTARHTEMFLSQETAPRATIDLALCARPSKQEFCAATCR